MISKTLQPYLVYIKLAAYALLLSLVFFGGCSVQKNIDTTEIAKLNQTITEGKAELDKQAREHSERLRKKEAEGTADLAKIEEEATKERERAKQNFDRTIADLRADNLRLRKRFTCPKPEATPATGIGDGGTQSGLQRDDAEFLIREAERADEVTRQLQEAQDVIRSYLKQINGN